MIEYPVEIRCEILSSILYNVYILRKTQNDNVDISSFKKQNIYFCERTVYFRST